MEQQAQNPFTLSDEETEAQARLQKTHTKLIRSRDELYARRQAAQLDLDKARDQHKAACGHLASGKIADTEAASAEIRRCEAMVAGVAQLLDAKDEELQACSVPLNVLNQKMAAHARFAERARLEETLNRKVERIAELKNEMQQAEAERFRASFELAEFMRANG